MAEPLREKNGQEPSMEEILASIRKIIADSDPAMDMQRPLRGGPARAAPSQPSRTPPPPTNGRQAAPDAAAMDAAPFGKAADIAADPAWPQPSQAPTRPNHEQWQRELGHATPDAEAESDDPEGFFEEDTADEFEMASDALPDVQSEPEIEPEADNDFGETDMLPEVTAASEPEIGETPRNASPTASAPAEQQARSVAGGPAANNHPVAEAPARPAASRYAIRSEQPASERPYRPAWSTGRAAEAKENGSGETPAQQVGPERFADMSRHLDRQSAPSSRAAPRSLDERTFQAPSPSQTPAPQPSSSSSHGEARGAVAEWQKERSARSAPETARKPEMHEAANDAADAASRETGAPSLSAFEPAISEEKAPDMSSGDQNRIDEQASPAPAPADRDAPAAEASAANAREPARAAAASAAPFDLASAADRPANKMPAREAESLSELVSRDATRQVAHSFSELRDAFVASRLRTFDEMAEELMRPMLKTWLDDNLPIIVERLVREEIERITQS